MTPNIEVSIANRVTEQGYEVPKEEWRFRVIVFGAENQIVNIVECHPDSLRDLFDDLNLYITEKTKLNGEHIETGELSFGDVAEITLLNMMEE